jgi:hypothetical protein
MDLSVQILRPPVWLQLSGQLKTRIRKMTFVVHSESEAEEFSEKGYGSVIFMRDASSAYY